MTRVTIEDVAERAGVSVATVSRAMRGLPNVSPSTRERVMETISEMSYRPDPNAARLAAGRSRTFAMAASALQLWYTGQVLAGAEAVLSTEGQDLLVVALQDGSASTLVSGLARRVDGVILLDIIPDEFEIASLTAMEVPWAVVGGYVESAHCMWIDNVDGARRAVSHLTDLGHSRIGLIGAAPNRMHSHTTDDRAEGYRQALEAVGLLVAEDLVADGGFSMEGGREAMKELLELSPRPTAVFAMSDDMAFGAILETRNQGLQIPNDLALIGFDDHDLSAAFGLSTIRQDPQLMGARCARGMIERLAGSTIGDRDQVQFPLELVERASTIG